MRSKVKKLVLLSIMLAIAIVVGYVESFIPIPVPGVKLGLANVVILLLLYEDNIVDAFIVLILRIFLTGFILGTFLTPTWYMSLTGGMLAFLVMTIFSRFNLFSSIGVSVLGSVFHTVGQITILIILVSTPGVIYYFPLIALLSIVTGIFSGIICILLRKRFKLILSKNNNWH